MSMNTSMNMNMNTSMNTNMGTNMSTSMKNARAGVIMNRNMSMAMRIIITTMGMMQMKCL